MQSKDDFFLFQNEFVQKSSFGFGTSWIQSDVFILFQLTDLINAKTEQAIWEFILIMI